MQVIYADDVQTINEVMYGPRSDTLLNDLRGGLSNYDQSILTDLGRRYETTVQQNFEAVSGWKIVNATRKAVSTLQGFDTPEVILPLISAAAFKTTPLIMQRFIMADIEVRQAWQKHRIDGWSDTYIDHQPKKIGHDHYDHRVLMNGIVQSTPQEDGTVRHEVTEFRHEMRKHDNPISVSNQLDLRRSTMFVRSRLKKGLDDLTSLYDEKVS